MRTIRAHAGRLQGRYLGELFRKIGAVLLPHPDKTVKLFDLAPDNGRFDLRHPVVEADHIPEVGHALVIYNRFGMVTNQTDAICELVAVCHHDTPFSAMDVFVVVQRVNAHIAHGAGIFPLVAGARCLGCIFDHNQSVFPGDGIYGIRIIGKAKDVHDDDRPCPGCDLFFHLRRIQAEIVRFHIGEYRNGVVNNRSDGRSTHRVRRYDDFLSWFNPCCPHGTI